MDGCVYDRVADLRAGNVAMFYSGGVRDAIAERAMRPHHRGGREYVLVRCDGAGAARAADRGWSVEHLGIPCPAQPDRLIAPSFCRSPAASP
jgi:hypothetical protein